MNCPICNAAIDGDGVCFGGTRFCNHPPFAYQKCEWLLVPSNPKRAAKLMATNHTTGTICPKCYGKYFAHQVGNALQIIVARGEK